MSLLCRLGSRGMGRVRGWVGGRREDGRRESELESAREGLKRKWAQGLPAGDTWMSPVVAQDLSYPLKPSRSRLAFELTKQKVDLALSFLLLPSLPPSLPPSHLRPSPFLLGPHHPPTDDSGKLVPSKRIESNPNRRTERIQRVPRVEGGRLSCFFSCVYLDEETSSTN